MAATILLNKFTAMQKLIKKLQALYPAVHFTSGKQFCWSPETKEVFYNESATGKEARWSLLHETGHAILGHTTYHADYELLRLEIEAWTKARQLASDLNIEIDEDHIQDCLDTYRDWLYKRSICPNCASKCLQESDYVHYRCFNCHTAWRVSTSRFTRSYRSTKKASKTLPLFKYKISA